MTPVTVSRGNSPIILGLPHAGTYVPPDIGANLNANGTALADTDWHIDRLYADLLPDATTVRAKFHRYVIDANRDPDGASLYPGQNTTALVPLTNFGGQDIWNTPPTDADIAGRRTAFHAPYHAAIRAEITRVRDLHGHAILFDCHSIRSRISYLFDGTLPDFNIGTDQGKTCAPRIERAVHEICRNAQGFSTVLNGRFKGGWTTRHYGRPNQNVHAIQLELAQSTYLATQSAPWAYDETKAARLRPHLAHILSTLATLVPIAGAPQ
ncbi:N-formylglutamate deformylase [uncultured Tateyamaria sp.]|uniref:N-formylglutamate deformylase n=1 Tax=uncultured Tateyamaria sp. TaxID=455651 RepID=UPI00260235B0|nr:N-formylglutamate deformylase [uncultured Tateyamaria sp.]